MLALLLCCGNSVSFGSATWGEVGACMYSFAKTPLRAAHAPEDTARMIQSGCRRRISRRPGMSAVLEGGGGEGERGFVDGGGGGGGLEGVFRFLTAMMVKGSRVAVFTCEARQWDDAWASWAVSGVVRSVEFG